MARVLISFLGTSPFEDLEKRKYKTAIYRIDNKEYKTPFVSAALQEHLNIDRKIIIGTVKSMWEEYYRYFSSDEAFDKKFYQDLISFTEKSDRNELNYQIINELEKKLSNTNIIIIKYGLNNDELRDNISSVLSIDDMLGRKDHVYIDTTHGFRSFPLLAQQVAFYLKQVSSKNIRIRNFYYGMLDASRDLGYTPIVDMKILLEMNDWVVGAYMFKMTTNADMIVSLLKKKNEKLANMLDLFSKSVNLNYAHEIEKQVRSISEYNVKDLEYPEKLVVEKVLGEFLNHFKNLDTHSKFQFDLSNWYFKKKNYSSAYLILSEAILTFVVEESGIDPFVQRDRDSAKTKIISKKYKELNKIYSKVNTIRKNIAHHLQKRQNSVLEDIESYKVYQKEFKKHLDKK